MGHQLSVAQNVVVSFEEAELKFSEVITHSVRCHENRSLVL